jgi:hypothetical protein
MRIWLKMETKTGAHLGNGSDEESDENKNAIETKSTHPKG